VIKAAQGIAKSRCQLMFPARSPSDLAPAALRTIEHGIPSLSDQDRETEKTERADELHPLDARFTSDKMVVSR
jgi:hypothetical protein